MKENIPDVLKNILKRKQEEIVERSRDVPLSKLVSDISHLPPPRRFTDVLLEHAASGKLGVIAEIKKASPSKGIIRKSFDVKSLAKTFEEAGAACLSVLTDSDFFHGSEKNLMEARQACLLPVLRKDFIIDPYQVAEARVIGADAILLIVAALSQNLMLELASFAKEVNLDILVEVHNRDELDRALELETEIIGINNRDLHDFTTTVETTLKLLPYVPSEKLVVTESGILSIQDVALMRENNVTTFLVGEAMMRATDPGYEFRKLFGNFS